MKTLEVTDEQYAFIQHLREEISDRVVGKYGFVRERDALQFLIDNLDGDLEVDGEFETTVADLPAVVEGSAGDGNAITYDENEGAIEPESDEDDGDENRESDADASTDEDAGADDQNDDAGESEADSESDEDEGATDDADGASDDGDGDGAADDDDMLDRMMSLLETHDDKWEESPSGDYRYRVTLPDGGTEDVQTKDDVRALLFKNYR